MKLFYAGDIHGSDKCWLKFLGAARFYGVDTLIMGGDITGKIMVPIVERAEGGYEANVLGRHERISTNQLDELEKRIRFNGFYPYRCSREEYQRLERDHLYREKTFTRVMVDEVRRWMRLAEEKLAGSGVRCFVMPGNDDEFAIDEGLESTYVVNPDGRVVLLDDVQVLSCSWTNRTPWDSPRELDESELADRLEDLAAQLDPGVPILFNLHCPPSDTQLDRAPALTADLKLILEGGEPRIIHVGSTAVRALIEKHRPILSLHGHIHESKAIEKIGPTTCVNPGSAYSEGVIDGALIEIAGGTVRSCQLVTG
jgi:Icc-related predicted phosphoesterase